MPQYKNDDQIGDYDFGFSFEHDTADELNTAKQEQERFALNSNIWEYRFLLLNKKIETLLSNLAQNPEKTTIRWPNRVEAINKFRVEMYDMHGAEPTSAQLANERADFERRYTNT